MIAGEKQVNVPAIIIRPSCEVNLGAGESGRTSTAKYT